MTAYSIAREPDGSYLVGGFFSAYDENNVGNVVRIQSTGAIDPSFAADAHNDSVQVIDRQADSWVFTGGEFSTPAAHLARLNAAGSIDSGFTPAGGPSGTVYTLAKDDAGALFVGGNFFSYEGATSRPIVKVASGADPYSTWSEAYFSSAEIAAGDAASLMDPDNDGLVNLGEYAMGTHPGVEDANTLFGVAENGISLASVDGELYLQLTLNKSSDVPGAWYAAQFGSDLSNLLPVAPSRAANSIYKVVEDSATTYTVRDNTPISTAARPC